MHGEQQPFTYVALGDSFTEGLEDVLPDGSYRGWADLVAEQLARHHGDLHYANLAVRGRRIEHVRDDQVPLVEQWRPDLVTVAIGGNDITGRHADIPALGREFDGILARLARTDAHVLAFAGFDCRVMIPLARTVSDRAREYNTFICASAAARGATLVDLWRLPRMYEPQLWAHDRLHMSTQGHTLVARAVLAALGVDASGVPEPPQQADTRSSLPQRLVSDVDWAARDLAPWLLRAARGRSSGDGREPKRPIPFSVRV